MGSQHGEHRFGGEWTEKKLRVLAGYLKGYTTALKDKPFTKAYIDAFAGTGYRNPSAGDAGPLLFPDLAQADSQALLDGSARIALRTEPSFNKYIFIERDATRCEALEALRLEFPGLGDDILIHQGDANTELRRLCSKDWSRRRAVVFLDPYGMQVDWRTIEAIAATRAIDLWILFPLGIGVNRLLTRDGNIPDPWRRSLDALFGTTDWYDEFYRVVEEPRDLFGDASDRIVKASVDTIGEYFNQRLKGIFAGVVERPGVLRNSRHSPLYLLCFAVGNERGKDIALRIARHLLKDLN